MAQVYFKCELLVIKNAGRYFRHLVVNLFNLKKIFRKEDHLPRPEHCLNQLAGHIVA